MKVAFAGLLLFIGVNASADLGLKSGVGPISLFCENDQFETDSFFAMEIQKDRLSFYPYESSFDVRDFNVVQVSGVEPRRDRNSLYMFKDAPVTFVSEGIETEMFVSGTILTDGKTADIEYKMSDESVSIRERVTCRLK